MVTNNTQKNTVNSDNQAGGITARNVIINNHNYTQWNILNRISLLIKNKRVKWISVIAAVITGGVTIYASVNGATREEIHKFLVVYFHSVEDKNADAKDYFTKNIDIFYTERNITPDRINEIRRIQDYTDRRYQINKESIKLRATVNGVNYWRFVMNMICYRPSKNKYEKCFAEMEFGIDTDDKITSIEQIRYWNLKYTTQKPSW